MKFTEAELEEIRREHGVKPEDVGPKWSDGKPTRSGKKNPVPAWVEEFFQNKV